MITKTKALNTNQLLSKVLNEIKSLREEIGFFLPTEDIEEYENPSKIKQSYEKALKKYPPASSWK